MEEMYDRLEAPQGWFEHVRYFFIRLGVTFEVIAIAGVVLWKWPELWDWLTRPLWALLKLILS